MAKYYLVRDITGEQLTKDSCGFLANSVLTEMPENNYRVILDMKGVRLHHNKDSLAALFNLSIRARQNGGIVSIINPPETFEVFAKRLRIRQYFNINTYLDQAIELMR